MTRLSRARRPTKREVYNMLCELWNAGLAARKKSERASARNGYGTLRTDADAMTAQWNAVARSAIALGAKAPCRD